LPREARKTSTVVTPAPLLAADDFGKELINWLFPAYVTLIVLCVFLFLSRGAMAQGHEMSFDRAVLTAVNSATLTGFPQSSGPNYFKFAGQFLVVLLTIVGSMFSLVVGGLAVRRILALPYTERQIVHAALIGEGAALLIGALGGCGQHQTILGGLSQGAAAFGNSGMMLGQPFPVKAWQTHLIVLPIVFLGGIGVTVLRELFDLLSHGRPLSSHARTVLAWSIGLYVAGTLGMTLLQWATAGGSLDSARASTWLASASVQAINTRTAGISFEYVHVYPRAVQWTMIVLMMIGAAPGGTGSGLKVTTVAVLVAGTRSLLRGENAGRPLGIAISWLSIYLGVAFVGLLMLLFVEPQLATDQSVFLTISALSNVGLAHDILPNMPKGAFVLSALMLAGRMVPLLVLWWMADSTPAATQQLAVG
jgi:trk system potassium uptake protein TrkH